MNVKIFILLILGLGITFTYLSIPKTSQLIKPTNYAAEELLPNSSILSIKQIFSDDHNLASKLPANRLRTIIATGDVIPARSVNFQTVQRRNFKWPFLLTANILKQADITFVNLESPLINKCPTTQEGMIFCGDSKHLEGLLYAGVDIVSFANNHLGNFGLEGIKETFSHLNDAGIQTTGSSIANLVIKDIRGIKFAFLGFNDIGANQTGISFADDKAIKNGIAQAKKQAAVVIVTFHWGKEYQAQPDERQRYLGHLAIESGADLVIGNHPHWIQPVEIYKGKLITYAHGNFIFDQEWSLKTKQGVVGRYTFMDDKLIDVEFLPVLVENYGQPRFLEEAEKQAILNNMELQSEKLSSVSGN